METIQNKVSQSGLLTFNLEDYYDTNARIVFDLKECLFMGLIIKEKEFREFIKTNDWELFRNANVAIICSADAIVPTWAYMLIASKLSGIANHFAFGDLTNLENSLFQNALSKIDIDAFRNQKVVIKGCGNLPITTNAYVEISRLLLPVVSSIMYGEPCSTVPVFKRKL